MINNYFGTLERKNITSLLTFTLAIISLYIVRIIPINKVLFFSLLLIVFSVTGLILIGTIIIIILDKIHRPNIPQYPFNKWLDRIIPLVFLLSPSLCILILHPFESWFTRLILLILIHIFLIIPMFHYWSQYRRWNDVENKFTYGSWNHPRLYKHIAIASIYPLLWGIYFSISRYLKLGSTIHIYEYFSFIDIDTIILLIFLVFYLVIYVFIILYQLSLLRRYLWSELSSLLYSIHIVLLHYYPYFRIMELIFKFGFLVRSLISINGPIYYRQLNESFYTTESKIRYITNYLYYHPGWFTLIFLLSILSEIVITGQLYYGIYTLFLYPLIRGTLSCFFTYNRTEFIFDCCFSDYIYRHWINPHYPSIFWMYFKDAEYFFNFQHDFNQYEVDVITQQLHKSTWKFRKVSQDIHQDLLDVRVNQIGKLIKYKRSFRMRLAAAYVSSNRVRWTHTQAFVKYHSCTALFARSIYDRIVLSNSSWRNVELIQRLKIVETTPQNMYINYGQTFKYNRKYFIGVHEENIPSNFKLLIEKGVKVEPYEKTYIPVYMPQDSPDVVLTFENSMFIDQRIHALDQKTGNPGLGKSLLLSEITEHRYKTTIDRLSQELINLNISNDHIKIVLIQLKNSCLDFKQHQLIWSENLHLFPSTHVPPMKVPQNFSYQEFSEEALRQIKISELRMKSVSDYLTFKKIPQVNHGTFPSEALNLMQDSQMQRILSGDGVTSSIDFVDNILD